MQIVSRLQVSALRVKPLLDLMVRESPLTTDLKPRQPAIVQHTVDGDPVYLQQLLQLSGRQQVIHA
jgi:hypothetical protein